uniref:Uncharacterized protein n=1 Tax=Trypanosoma congolense (strain IL3000) TaxID=1068625 RepID=G0UMS5_TRYCI|nr:conserved hypothetical protein [Trypanosoma congolense IL3000]
MFRPSLRCSIGTISTAMANLTIFAANTFAVYDAFGVLFLGGVTFRLFSVTATIYGDCCVARAACALPELREAHGQYKAIVDHPRAIFWEKKVAAQRLKNDRDRIFRSHRIDNTRLVLPHACAAFMSCYGLCVPAQQLRECLSSLPADSPLSFQVAGVGSCDVALPLAVTLTFLNTYDHLQRRKGFSDGLDAWIRQINKYGTVAWTLLTFVTLCTHFAGCVAFLPPHVAPVWLGISVTSACKSLIVNHTAPMRALFGIRDYPRSHGVCRAMSTAEVHEYRLAFTGVDVEERHSMWQTQKKALDYECNVRLYRMLGRMGLFDRVEEAEHEAKNLQRKLNMARSRRKEQELKRKEGRGDEGEKEAMIKTPPIRGEDIVGPSADAVAEHCYDDLQVEENERRRQRRQVDGG